MENLIISVCTYIVDEKNHIKSSSLRITKIYLRDPGLTFALFQMIYQILWKKQKYNLKFFLII